MSRILQELAALFDLIRPAVFAPVFCDRCAVRRTHLTRTEAAILTARGRALCRCGGYLNYIGPDFEEVKP